MLSILLSTQLNLNNTTVTQWFSLSWRYPKRLIDLPAACYQVRAYHDTGGQVLILLGL